MNANGASILVNPHPRGHIVYPYTDEVLVGQAVALFASAGLRGGEGVILIMSADHCESIKLRLQLEGWPQICTNVPNSLSAQPQKIF